MRPADNNHEAAASDERASRRDDALGPGGGALLSSIIENVVAQSAIAGFAAGAVASGTFKGAVQGGFTAVVFYGVGTEFGTIKAASGAVDPELLGRAVAAHAVAGCVTSVVGGGKCGPGALSAAFSKLATPITGQINPVAGTVVSAVIGGTAAELGGGKFANGAVTGAFGYLFNELLHEHDGSAAGRRRAMQLSGYYDIYDPPLEGAYPEALFIGGPIGRAIAGAFEALTTTTLYRAVGEAEMADILATGGFRNALGLESKYFSSTLEGAQRYADMASRAFGDAMTIVKTRIPTSWITNTMRVEVDGGVPAVVVPTARLPGLKPPIVVKPGG